MKGGRGWGEGGGWGEEGEKGDGEATASHLPYASTFPHPISLEHYRAGSSWISVHKADHRVSRHRFLAAYLLPPPLAPQHDWRRITVAAGCSRHDRAAAPEADPAARKRVGPGEHIDRGPSSSIYTRCMHTCNFAHPRSTSQPSLPVDSHAPAPLPAGTA